MKKLRYVFVIVLCGVLLLGFTSCIPYRYKGDYIDLFTVAVNNMFGSDGYDTFEFHDIHPYIEVIESDNYGRKLFFFTDRKGRAFGTAIFVMQKSDDKFVYYYQDDCYIPYQMEQEFETIRENYWEALPKDEIAELKERNDWNSEINLEKCTKSEIRDDHPSGKLKDSAFEPALKAYAQKNGYKGNDTLFRYAILYNADSYGRELYYVYGIGCDVHGDDVSSTSNTQYFRVAMLFEADRSCPMENICEVSPDSTDYYEKIMELKRKANWNKPLE